MADLFWSEPRNFQLHHFQMHFQLHLIYKISVPINPGFILTQFQRL